MNKLLIPLLALVLSSCNRPAPKVGEVWRYHATMKDNNPFHSQKTDSVDEQFQVLEIQGDYIRYKDMIYGGESTSTIDYFMIDAQKVGEVKPVQHYRMMDTGRVMIDSVPTFTSYLIDTRTNTIAIDHRTKLPSLPSKNPKEGDLVKDIWGQYCYFNGESWVVLTEIKEH